MSEQIEPEETTESDEESGALGLIAALVEQNVKDASFTTNRLIEGMQAQIDYLSKALVNLYGAVNSAADVVTTRKLERALVAAGPAVDSAYRHLERASEVN